jgi:hypothetical protein
MTARNFYIATRLITVLTFILISSCAVLPMKGYEGPDLPADKTAVIENGVYIDIDKFDGMKLGSFRNSVITLPGDHTIEMSFLTQTLSDLVLYSRETASLSFKAEAGHTYVAYARWVSTEGWIALIKDKKTDERVAQSEILPIIWEHIVGDL